MQIGRQGWIGAIFGLSLLGASGAAHGAVISNFSGVFDTTTDRLQISFDIDPVDADTPLGVDSINFDFDGFDLADEPFVDGVSALLFSSLPGATGEFLDTDEFIIDFPVLNALTSVTFIIDNVVTTGLANDPGYDMDFFVNTTAGATPSALGQQFIANVATQDDFTKGSIPAPGTVALLGLGLAGLGLVRRRRKAA